MISNEVLSNHFLVSLGSEINLTSFFRNRFGPFEPVTDLHPNLPGQQHFPLRPHYPDPMVLSLPSCNRLSTLYRGLRIEWVKLERPRVEVFDIKFLTWLNPHIESLNKRKKLHEKKKELVLRWIWRVHVSCIFPREEPTTLPPSVFVTSQVRRIKDGSRVFPKRRSGDPEGPCTKLWEIYPVEVRDNEILRYLFSFSSTDPL